MNETEEVKIRYIQIDLKDRTIACHTSAWAPVDFPLSTSGHNIIKWTKVSSGGLIIQALARMLDGLRHEGGNTV